MTSPIRCLCEIPEGQPAIPTGECPFHALGEPSACPSTNCPVYRPIRSVPRHKPDTFRWPRCVCGEIAQQHG